MRHHGRWPTVAVFLVTELASGCMESPDSESAVASDGPTVNVQSAPLMTVNQLMHAIVFPLGNAVFFRSPRARPR